MLFGAVSSVPARRCGTTWVGVLARGPGAWHGTPMPVAIRPATAADCPAVVALLLAQLREHAIDLPAPALTRSVRGVLRHPSRGLILVATAGQRPIGVAALSFVWPLEHGGRSVWLEELYVEPARRGHGTGRRPLRVRRARDRDRRAALPPRSPRPRLGNRSKTTSWIEWDARVSRWW